MNVAKVLFDFEEIFFSFLINVNYIFVYKMNQFRLYFIVKLMLMLSIISLFSILTTFFWIESFSPSHVSGIQKIGIFLWNTRQTSPEQTYP